MHVLNDPAPWWGFSQPTPYSAIDLIAQGTLSSVGAASLWWLVERGASVLVVAGPRGAGKTTLATALFSFLPDEAVVYVVAGPRDSLSVSVDRRPVWLLVNELSNHTPAYVHGPAARQAFLLLRHGARMIATAHATRAADVAEVLDYDAGVSRDLAALLDAAVVLEARRTAEGVVRRVVEVALLRDREAPETVARRGGADTDLVLTSGATATLATWAGVPAEAVEREIAARDRYLVATGRRGVHTREDVTAAVQYFRRHHGVSNGAA